MPSSDNKTKMYTISVAFRNIKYPQQYRNVCDDASDVMFLVLQCIPMHTDTVSYILKCFLNSVHAAVFTVIFYFDLIAL
jgi:hypothetical protein